MILLSIAPDTPPRYCQASSESSTSMNVSWILPEKPNGLIEYYIIIYTPLKSLSGVDYNDISYNLTTPTNISQLIIPGLLKATTYRFSLIAHTVIGGSPPSNNTCQQTTLEDGQYIIHSFLHSCIHYIIFLQFQSNLLKPLMLFHLLPHLSDFLGTCQTSYTGMALSQDTESHTPLSHLRLEM